MDVDEGSDQNLHLALFDLSALTFFSDICSYHIINTKIWERSGSVLECLTQAEGPRIRVSPASLRCGP